MLRGGGSTFRLPFGAALPFCDAFDNCNSLCAPAFSSPAAASPCPPCPSSCSPPSARARSRGPQIASPASQEVRPRCTRKPEEPQRPRKQPNSGALTPALAPAAAQGPEQGGCLALYVLASAPSGSCISAGESSCGNARIDSDWVCGSWVWQGKLNIRLPPARASTICREPRVRVHVVDLPSASARFAAGRVAAARNLRDIVTEVEDLQA